MPHQAVGNSIITCTCDGTPIPYVLLPIFRVLVSNFIAGNMMDNKPIVNIPICPMCKSAAPPFTKGPPPPVYRPGPGPSNCPAPWVIIEKTMIGNMPTLNITAKLICGWGGVISFTAPIQVFTQSA